MSAARGRGTADPPFPRHDPPPPHELGLGRLEPGIPNGRPQRVLRIDATGAPSTLMGRLLVGSYITGQDQVFVTARGGLTPAQRSEVHHVVDRLLGMTVVGDNPDGIEVLNFIDPTKYELPRLLRRMVELLRRELEICRLALEARRDAELGRIEDLEEEIDQLYFLMVRQLLLSSDDPRIAEDIDVTSHHYQIGYRLVAKVLEVTGDLIQAVGSEIRTHLEGLLGLPAPVRLEIARRIGRLDGFLARSMASFTTVSVIEADATLNVIAEALPRYVALAQQLPQRVPDKVAGGAAQRIVGSLAVVLEMLVIVNETTINRSVEPETVARTSARVMSSWACEGDPSPGHPRVHSPLGRRGSPGQSR